MVVQNKKYLNWKKFYPFNTSIATSYTNPSRFKLLWNHFPFFFSVIFVLFCFFSFDFNQSTLPVIVSICLQCQSISWLMSASTRKGLLHLQILILKSPIQYFSSKIVTLFMQTIRSEIGLGCIASTMHCTQSEFFKRVDHYSLVMNFCHWQYS